MTVESRADSLATLVQDAGVLALLMRDGASPRDPHAFAARTTRLLADIQAAARDAGHPPQDVADMTFALDALLAEGIDDGLAWSPSSQDPEKIVVRRVATENAEEGFFERLARLRAEENPRIEVLEVYHLALLLGYRGQYRFEGTEKLRYLASSLGQDLARLRGSRASFAPSATPEAVPRAAQGASLPPWRFLAIAVAVAGCAWFGYAWLLRDRGEMVLEAVRGMLGG